MANNYEVNYDDERFTQVEADKQEALSDLEQTYAGMIGETDQYYQAQIDASKQWADTQNQLQQEKTDFAIEQIEQQKDQAHKDYLKEQSGAYKDWQKQSNPYGAEAEKMAAGGMTNTGFAESSQVGMYNTYQNRVTTARESYNQAVLNYNNAIKDARIQNNAIQAEIAYNALQQQLELSLQGFQYKNQLILEQANRKVEMDNIYYNRYMDVLNQINTENAMAEEVRQFNQSYDLQVKQFNEEIRQFNQQYNENVRQFNKEFEQRQAEYKEGIRQFNEEIARLKEKDAKEYELEIKNLELKKDQLAQEQKQWEAEMSFKKSQLAEQKRQFDAQMAENEAKLTQTSSKPQASSRALANAAKNATVQQDNTKASTYSTNRASLDAIGLGNATAADLARLIDQGLVTRTLKNGQWYYSRPYTYKNNNRFKNLDLSKG